MKICIITSSYPLNPNDGQAAAGFFVRDFALAISAAGHSVYILTQAREGPHIEDNQELNVIRYKWAKENRPLSTLNPLNPFGLLKILLLLKNGEKDLIGMIHKQRIDFCLAMWAVPSGYLAYRAYKRTGVPYAVWALGSDIWAYGRNPLCRMLLKNILGNAKKLFADGRELAAEVEKISRNNCAFLASSRVLNNPPGKINIDETKTNFLFIGRYHKHKGVDVLIEAIRLVPQERLRTMYFYFFGGGPLEKIIKEKIRQYYLEDFVYLGGFIDFKKASAYLSSCDCLIIPSRIESIPIILSDALQTHIPLIVTDTGDMGKLVREYEAGIVVKPQDPEELRDAIVEFGLNNKNRYSQGSGDFKKIFDIEENAKIFLESASCFAGGRSIRR